MVMTKEMMDDNKLISLRAEIDEKGIIHLNSRALEGFSKHYDTTKFPILTEKDPITYLWIKKIHNEDYSGVTKTVSKSRRKFWIIRARKIASKEKRDCYLCRLIDKELAQQQMAPLPSSRMVMSPIFNEISLDLL